jgi:TatA/E family protein of Tat protein translocase
MFDIGTQELIIIFIVALLVFGPKKLPELGRTLGKGIKELKSALSGVTDSIEEAGIEDEIKKAKENVVGSLRENVVDNLIKDGKVDLGEDEDEKKAVKELNQEKASEEAYKKETEKDG